MVAVCFVTGALQLRGEWRLSVAIAAMLGYDVLAIVLGGSYWAHYMLGLVAPLAIAAAFASRATRSQIAVQWVAGLVAACALTAAIGGLVRIHEDGVPRRDDEVIADWLKDASHPGDTSSSPTASPTSWPPRVSGPPTRTHGACRSGSATQNLTHLTALLTTPAAPTWLVEVGDFDWWGLDTPAFHRMREVRYTLVDNICGKDIYLRVDEPRELPPSPTCD